MEWIAKARENNCIVTGPIIQTVANRIARIQGIPEEQFKASNGWLQHFKTRNKIVSKLLQGERGDAPVENAESFRINLPELLSSYEPKNIFNADEVGLFYEQTGRRTYVLQSDDDAGVKQSKKRISILVVAAMDGALEKMVVINNSRCPRAFDAINRDPSRLPSCISWKSNRKAWMTTEIFKDWLQEFNRKMNSEKRQTILFLDNFSAHQAAVEVTDLSNVAVKFLPANCTSIIQPVDQGIGNALKIRYRKYLLEHMSNMVFLDKPAREGVNILRTCVWLARAFNSLNGSDTVRKCFRKAGFMMPEPSLVFHETEDTEDTDDLSNNADPLLSMEADVAIPPPTNAEDLITDHALKCIVQGEEDCMSPDSELPSNDQPPKSVAISSREASKLLLDIEGFFVSRGLHGEANTAHNLFITASDISKREVKQSKITDFFY